MKNYYADAWKNKLKMRKMNRNFPMSSLVHWTEKEQFAMAEQLGGKFCRSSDRFFRESQFRVFSCSQIFAPIIYFHSRRTRFPRLIQRNICNANFTRIMKLAELFLPFFWSYVNTRNERTSGMFHTKFARSSSTKWGQSLR